MFWLVFNDIGGVGIVFIRYFYVDDQTSDKYGDVVWRKVVGQRFGREENDVGDYCQTTFVAVIYSVEYQVVELARDKGCRDQICRLYRRQFEFILYFGEYQGD